MENLELIFKALSDPIRLQILKKFLIKNVQITLSMPVIQEKQRKKS